MWTLKRICSLALPCCRLQGIPFQRFPPSGVGEEGVLFNLIHSDNFFKSAWNISRGGGGCGALIA